MAKKKIEKLMPRLREAAKVSEITLEDALENAPNFVKFLRGLYSNSVYVGRVFSGSSPNAKFVFKSIIDAIKLPQTSSSSYDGKNCLSIDEEATCHHECIYVEVKCEDKTLGLYEEYSWIKDDGQVCGIRRFYGNLPVILEKSGGRERHTPIPFP